MRGAVPNRNAALDLDVPDSTDAPEGLNTPLDEATIMLQIILESMRSLFRIGVLVQKSSPRDRFKRALKASQMPILASFDIDRVEQKHPKTRSTGLATRLGGAIAKRRQFIMYCRDHRLHLGTDEEDTKVLATATQRVSSKATTFVPQPDTLQVEPEHDAVTTLTVSTISDSTSDLQLPRLADLCQNQEPFECPICFTLQSFQSESCWR